MINVKPVLPFRFLRIVVLLPTLLVGLAYAENFVDSTKISNISAVHQPPIFDKKLEHIMGMISAGASGGGIGDYNNDGLLDIFINNPRKGKRNYLYENKGNFKFEDVTIKANLHNINDDSGVASMGIFFDYDGDGWQDFLAVRMGYSKLYKNNRNGTFVDVTDKSGLRGYPINALTAIAFDYDRDGDLDLYLGSYFRDIDMYNLGGEQEVLHDSWEVSRNGGSNLFFENLGNGSFKERTQELGLIDTGWTMALAHLDIDNDGWQDIYVANDYGADVIFKNDEGKRFVNVSDDSIGVDTKKGMNAESGDFDNDGDMDVFVTNVTEEFLYECNMLWQNDGLGNYVDVSTELGVCDTGWGWAGKFMDYDNDGWLDLYVANGFFTGSKKEDYLDILLPAIWESGEDPSDPSVWPPLDGRGMAASEKNVLYRNVKGKFVEIKDSGLSVEKDTRAILLADFDNNGRVDALITNNDNSVQVFRNESDAGNWLQVKLHGRPPNTDAAGARITLTYKAGTQMREVNIGNGFGGGSMLRQHFGLGENKVVHKVEVMWPDGSKQTIMNPKINALLEITQNAS